MTDEHSTQSTQPTDQTSLASQQPEGTEPTKTQEPTAEKPPEQKAPEALAATDIVLPEGVEPVDDAVKESLISILNQYKVPKEGLQKLVDLQLGVMKAASERVSGLWNQTQDTWRKEIMADSEFGGAQLKSNLGQISRLIDKYAPNGTKFREMMDLTGAGNHPEMIKFLTKIARDTIQEGEAIQGQPPTSGRSHAEILFPDQGRS